MDRRKTLDKQHLRPEEVFQSKMKGCFSIIFYIVVFIKILLVAAAEFHQMLPFSSLTLRPQPRARRQRRAVSLR